MAVRHGVTCTRTTRAMQSLPARGGFVIAYAAQILKQVLTNGYLSSICKNASNVPCAAKRVPMLLSTRAIYAPALYARYASYVRYLKYMCML